MVNTITNITTAATGDQMDPSTAGDDLSEAVIVDNTTDLVTVKTLASGDATPDEGDSVTFQIDVHETTAVPKQTNVFAKPTCCLRESRSPAARFSQGSLRLRLQVCGTIGTLNDGAVATITLVWKRFDVGQGGKHDHQHHNSCNWRPRRSFDCRRTI